MITILTIPDCKHCKEVKDYLKENNIEFKETNLKAKENSEARVYWRSLGFNVAPIVLIDSENGAYVHAYKDKQEFIKFIEDNHGKKENK
jgi:glutaredoxin